MDQNQRIKYSPLSEDAKTSFSDNSIANSQRGLLSGNDNAAYDDDDRSRMRLQFRILITANGLLFILSIAALVASNILVSRCTFDYGLNAALKKTSGYSPVLDLVEIPMGTVQFDGTLFDPDPNPIYRQPPSPDVDAAWHKISVLGAIGISKEDVERVGKDPSVSVTAPDSWGLGERNYLAYVDVFHQIHCLDTLRKAAHYDYYHRKRFGAEGPTNGYWAHVQHCTYMLLQTLQCHADVDVFTYTWVEGQEHPYPDFSANHQCRDFDAVWEWTHAHHLDIQRSREYLKPEGVNSQPEPGTFAGQADWAFEKAHGEFSEGYQSPKVPVHLHEDTLA